MMAERLQGYRMDVNNPNTKGFVPGVVRELLDHIAQLEAQRGWAVVVAEPTVKQWIKEVLDAAYNDPEPHATMRAATKWFRENSKAIPADRVLADGMVEVDRERLAALEAISDKIEALALGPDGRAWTPLHYREFARGELRRAQQAKGE